MMLMLLLLVFDPIMAVEVEQCGLGNFWKLIVLKNFLHIQISRTPFMSYFTCFSHPETQISPAKKKYRPECHMTTKTRFCEQNLSRAQPETR
jgi:hypothetical protein